MSIHHDAVPDSFLEEWKFEGKKNHFRDRFRRYSIFGCLENRKFMAALKFVRLLGLKIKIYSLQLDPQYSQAIMGRYWRQLLDRNTGVYRFDHLVVLQRARMSAFLFEAGSIINRTKSRR